MPDYPAMYKRLFQSQTKAIEILQQAQQDTEEMYIQAPDPAIHLHKTKTPQTEKAPENKEPQSKDRGFNLCFQRSAGTRSRRR